MSVENSITVVMLSWKRVKNIKKIIKLYENYGCISEIIVWNNNKREKIESCGKTNVVNCSRDMGLDSRFHAALFAKTEAVLIQDDDIFLPEETVLSLLNHWREEPDLIHGIFGRNPRKDGSYAEFKDCEDAECDVVLTRAMVFSKKIVPKFFLNRFEPEIKEAKEKIRKTGTHPENGEDILFPYTAMSESGKKNKIYKLKYIDLYSSGEGISSKKGHWESRTIMMRACLKRFSLTPRPD